MMVNILHIPNTRKIVIFTIFFLISLENSTSQVTGGGYGESYLLRNVGARAIGMAGAYTAIVNEPTGIFYNPAGLAYSSTEATINASFSALSFGRNHSSISWMQLVHENIGLGFGFNSITSGTFDARNVRGEKTGTMSDFQYSMNLGAAYNIESMSMGVNLKYLANSLAGSNLFGSGVALDIGTKFDVMGIFSFGMSVQNLSGMMFWNTLDKTREDIPYTIRSGIAMEFGMNADSYETRSPVTGEVEQVNVAPTRYFLIGLDAVFTQYEKSPSLVIGVEAAAHEMIVFRGGISIYGDKLGEPQLFPMNNWGGGISLRPKLKGLPFQMHLDYSIANEFLSESGIGHHISVIAEF